MNRKFWGNKNVLITGHEGFLGSNLVKRIISQGANVIGLDISVNRKTTLLTKDDYKKIKVVKGNVANYKLLKELINKNNIEIVFHLAAEAIVEKCWKRPTLAFSSNIEGTWSLLEACRHSPKIKAVVVASSDKAYGSYEHLPYREDTPLRGKHPYDVSKSCADLIAYTYFHTYGLPVMITRCGNIYGPGDFNFSRIIPDAIKSALYDEKFLIRSDGKFTRDYIFVEDIVDGYIAIAQKSKECDLSGEAFNFSNENPVPVASLVKTIYKLMGKVPNYKICNRVSYEIVHQYLDAGKARKKLDWKPKYNLEKGLRKTINWYTEYFL